MTKRRKPQATTLITVTLLLSLTMSSYAQSRRHNKDKEDDPAPISVMDSTEAQWGMRSVNASVYQGLPLNAVYLERGRQRLPDSFPHYQQGKLNQDIVVRSSSTQSKETPNTPPNTMRVNGVETPLGTQAITTP